MPFRSYSEVVAAENAGKSLYATWRKTPSQATTSGVWFDMSMSPGNPVPNYYAAAPNIAQKLSQSSDGGLYHGPSLGGTTKHLKSFMAMTAGAAGAPLPMMLCDYLMFYPFIDMSVTDYQPLDTQIALPRYPTGAGVEVMAVEVAGQSGVGNPRFSITYTNQNGESGKVSPLVTCNTITTNGTIITSAPNTAGCAGPFIPLASGDTGVRKIDGVRFYSADVGLISLVLVNPIANFAIREITAPVEKDFAVDFMSLPIIQPDAYLNLLCLPNSNLSGTAFHGSAQFIWS